MRNVSHARLLALPSAILISLSLASCSPSSNASACAAYEAAFNALSDAVTNGETPDQLWKRMGSMDEQIDLALQGAEGDVRETMAASRDAAALVDRGDTGERSGDFFYSSTQVAAACEAAGSAIALGNLS